ncbi:peroxiredoxin [Pseudaestuariivita rosea]|uniref:peroxiredoxin n=1 Tax=Pseudaestuariivita rosea TaxID=2763263 RepID=UPI001ABAD1BF|nr:peroxiredoxin [Pseudaestuariivita rosea]
MGDHLNTVDWSRLPAPEDDGGADHLSGAAVPSVSLAATDGGFVDLSKLVGLTVVYIYPRTGQPDTPLPDGWNMIPGARGCTPQSCAFRDHFADLKAVGVDHLFGLSTQDTAYQSDAAHRLHLPFPLLSDEGLKLADAMRLPRFQVDGLTLLKRLTLILRDGVVVRHFYPVFPPDRNAADVIDWLNKQD